MKDAMEYIGCAFVPIGTGASDRVITTTRMLNTNVMHATPSYALYLAEYAKKRGINPAELGFKKITVGAELGGGIPSVRKQIQDDYNAILTEGLGNSDTAPVFWGM